MLTVAAFGSDGLESTEEAEMVSYKLISLGVLAVPIGAGTLYVGKSIATNVTGHETPAGIALMAQLLTARDGEVIRLGNKDYGVVTFPTVAHATPIRIEAKEARFVGLVLKDVSGVRVEGGLVDGPGGKSYGISIDHGSNIAITGMKITGAHRGLVINKSHDIVVQANTFTALLSDGIDLALSRNIIVRGNSCSHFSPTMQAFDGQGRATTAGGDHPDCIQAWSRPSDPPTSDIIIAANRIDGEMQGIFFGNHVRAGLDDGGFDRVVIRNNLIKISLYNGIALGGARDSVVTGNVVSTISGSFNPRKTRAPIRAWIRVAGGERNTVCGNKVADFPRDISAQPCPEIGTSR